MPGNEWRRRSDEKEMLKKYCRRRHDIKGMARKELCLRNYKEKMTSK
jgi:hypothetical protein